MIAASLALMLALQEPGKTDVIKCAADPAQNYACYVPKAYTKAKKWPILYCYSPNAQGGYFVDLYRDVCEEEDVVCAADWSELRRLLEPVLA